MIGLTATFLVLDVVFHYIAFFKLNMYVTLPVQVICKIGIMVAFFWVFVCNGRVKKQLKTKYPNGIGRCLKVEETKRKTVSVLWKERVYGDSLVMSMTSY